ncbi:MAG: PH domain-containing protein [Phycisphaerae bacterium]
MRQIPPMANGPPPATITAPGLTVVPARLLDEGEIVILAIKPSGWFCLLNSLPVLLACGVVIALVCLTQGSWLLPLPRDVVALICVTGMAFRLLVAWLQWMGRLYVLTNLRAITVRGLFREEVFSCPLRKIIKAESSATVTERAVMVANILFQVAERQILPPWINVSYPAEVLAIVQESIGRNR